MRAGVRYLARQTGEGEGMFPTGSLAEFFSVVPDLLAANPCGSKVLRVKAIPSKGPGDFEEQEIGGVTDLD